MSFPVSRLLGWFPQTKLGAWLVADSARCALGLGLALLFAHCDSH